MTEIIETVSVIIPCYNTGQYLSTAILSAMEQTVKPHEIIVVNDASTDNTEDVINSFGSKIKHIKNEKNLGIGGARKTGVENATGDYIAFISADDKMERNFLEEMLKCAKLHPDCIIYSDFHEINENNQILRTIRIPTYNSYDDWLISVVGQANDNKMSVVYNLFAPTKLLKENNFNEKYRFGEDLEHFLRCAVVKKIKFIHVPLPLFSYRVHVNMVTNTAGWGNIANNNKKIFKEMNEMLGKEVFG